MKFNQVQFSSSRTTPLPEHPKSMLPAAQLTDFKQVLNRISFHWSHKDQRNVGNRNQELSPSTTRNGSQSDTRKPLALTPKSEPTTAVCGGSLPPEIFTFSASISPVDQPWHEQTRCLGFVFVGASLEEAKSCWPLRQYTYRDTSTRQCLGFERLKTC